MEDQVPSSNIPQETGSYYQSPEGPRFQNPAEFADHFYSIDEPVSDIIKMSFFDDLIRI